MMTEATRLDSTLQAIVDERLDAIDRVLLEAEVSRAERRGVIEEVEAQIYELLGRRTSGEPTRGDVASVLDALDPPEAYAPEGSRRRWASERRGPVRPRVPQPSLLALASGLGGLMVAGLALLLALLVLDADDWSLMILTFAGLCVVGTAVFAGGILAIRQIREAQGWLTALPAAVFAALLFPLVIINGFVFGAIVATEYAALFALTGLAILAGNAYLIKHAWRWASADYRPAQPRWEQ
jgi:hypothetical protein